MCGWHPATTAFRHSLVRGRMCGYTRGLSAQHWATSPGRASLPFPQLTLPTPVPYPGGSANSKSGPSSSGGTKAWGSPQPCGQRELHYDWARPGWPEPITVQGRQVCPDWLVLVLGRMDARKAPPLLSGPPDVLGDRPQQSGWFCPRQARVWTQSQSPTSVHSGSLTYQLRN